MFIFQINIFFKNEFFKQACLMISFAFIASFFLIYSLQLTMLSVIT